MAARSSPEPGAGAPEVALSCLGIGKSYDGIEVLRDVSLSVGRGTLTVLVGENGAGKSTLFRLISGQAAPDRGTIAIGGRTVAQYEPRAASALGVSIIPQELQPIPQMRVYENLLLGRELRNPVGLLRRRRMKEIAREMLESIGLALDPDLPLRRLNIAQMQLIEILKATTRDASVVLMDEPTSSLSAGEREHLFTVIARLKRQGVAILYTSHKMEEIEAIADNVAVLRDGRLIREAGAGEVDEAQLITDMVGRAIDELFPPKVFVPPSVSPVLEVRDFVVRGFGPANNFAVRPGEIVGLGGLAGAGRSEMMEGLFGLRPATGSVTLCGAPFGLGSVAHAIRRGIAMVPEDRKQAGVLTTLSILDNVSLPYLGRFVGPGGWVRGASRRRVAADILARTGVRYARLGQKVVHLSGGNQQKIALARWLVGELPRLLILDEPTRGIDVAARSDLYRLIAELAAQGVAVLLASSDMPELLGLSHRVLVMRRGAIVGDVASDALSQEAVLRLAMGASR